MTREEKERIQQKLHRAADAHLNAYGGNLYYEGVARGLEQAAGIVGKTKCEEEPRWIPCSERVPDKVSDDKCEVVLVLDEDMKSVELGAYHDGQWIGLMRRSRINVAAWYPLPRLGPWEEKK